MVLIDQQGRILGKINVIDALAIILFILASWGIITFVNSLVLK